MNETRLYNELHACGYGYYSPKACEIILREEDEVDQNWEFDPVAIASVWTEYTPKDLIREYGYLTEAGGYSYHQLEEMTDDEAEDSVEEILENMPIFTSHICWRVPQEDTILLRE